MTRPLPIPVISDEPVASVLRSLQLTETGEDAFEANSLPQMRRVYGGQLVSQSMVAAMATIADADGADADSWDVEGARLPNFLHAMFILGGDPSQSIGMQVERLRDGRTFSTREVQATQGGREIFRMTCSFQNPEGGPECMPEPPVAPEPEGLRSAVDLFREMDNPVGRFLGRTTAYDIRHVGRNLYIGADPSREPRQQLWMRPRVEIPEPAGPGLRRAMLAYVIDQIMLEPAMRSVGLSWIAPGLAVASLDHSMWFHRDFDLNDWLLVDGQVISVNNGRALTTANVFTADGTLVASAAQQGMIRVPDDDHPAKSSWGIAERSA